MMRLCLLALLGLGCVGATTAQAQWFSRPYAGGYGRYPYGGYGGLFGPGYGAGYGSPYGGYPYGGYPYGGIVLGNPAAIAPGGRPVVGGNQGIGFMPGGFPAGSQAALGGLGQSGSSTTGEYRTGHSVRFQAWRGYFQNLNPTPTQSGATAASPLAQGINPALSGTGGAARFGDNAPGKRPPRPKGASGR